MDLIIGGCGPQLTRYLQTTDECWIAVALLSRTGFDYLQQHLPADCKHHYLVGTWLPSDAGVLKQLLDWGQDVRIFTNSGFHPKLYLLRQGRKYTAFLGSSNATSNGLFNNIELNVQLDDQATCKELLSWFELTSSAGKRITERFLNSYKPIQLQRRATTRQIDTEQEELRSLLESHATLIRSLQKLRRRTKFYREHSLRRQEDVQQLRDSLDFPHFKRLDLDSFLPNRALGTVMGFHWPKIRQNQKGFRRLLRFLAWSQLSIAATLEEALGPQYKMDGVGVALVTKLLTMLHPDKYCTWNNRSDAILRQLGYEPEHGTALSQKYERLCKLLRAVAHECNIRNLAVLDYCLLLLEGE
jgi:HKD family nuclease